MTRDELIDGRTCSPWVATDWDHDPHDMAMRAMRVRVASERDDEEEAG